MAIHGWSIAGFTPFLALTSGGFLVTAFIGRETISTYLNRWPLCIICIEPIRVGDKAEIFDAARPDVQLSASVTRVSGELDPKTRTLLTELDLDNRNEQILAGSSVRVSLKIKIAPSLEIPTDAMIPKNETTMVAVITSDNKVHFKPVVVLESDGKVLRLTGGLEEGERVVLNPGFDISEGEQIQPVEATF